MRSWASVCQRQVGKHGWTKREGGHTSGGQATENTGSTGGGGREGGATHLWFTPTGQYENQNERQMK